MSFPPLLSCVTLTGESGQMNVNCNNTMMGKPVAAGTFVVTFDKILVCKFKETLQEKLMWFVA